jgi:hypothetical protein
MDGAPLLIDPSITFRKHFELPATVNKDPRTLKLELFSRFLPADLDDYICQFQDGPTTDNNTKRVIGLAIKEKDMQWLEGLHGKGGEKYILENLLEAPDEPDCQLKLNLPEGIYYGIFEDGFLSWARFLKSPEESMITETEDYIAEEYPHLETRYESPDFEIDSNEPSWGEFLDDWLPAQPDPSRIVVRPKDRNFWDQWRQTAWILLVLILLTSGTWWCYNYYVIRQNQQWINARAERFLNGSNNPADYLQSEITSMRETIESMQEIPDVFPRIARLDEVLGNADIHLLQMKFKGKQAQLVFMTKSLKIAEKLKEDILAIDGVDRTEIVSTNPQQQEEFQFRVNINLLWNPTAGGSSS